MQSVVCFSITKSLSLSTAEWMFPKIVYTTDWAVLPAAKTVYFPMLIGNAFCADQENSVYSPVEVFAHHWKILLFIITLGHQQSVDSLISRYVEVHQ